LISILDGNQNTYCAVSGALTSDLTDNKYSRVCRVFVTKADASTLDYLLYNVTDKVIITGRVVSGPQVIYVTAFTS